MPSGLSPIRLATSRRLRSIPRAERLLPTQSAWPPVDLVATYRRVAPRRRPFACEPVPPNRCRQSTRCQAIRAATRRRRRADAFLGDLDIVAHSGHALRSPPVGGLFIWGRAPGEALRPRGGRARRGRRRHAAPSAAPRYAPCRRRARRPRGGRRGRARAVRGGVADRSKSVLPPPAPSRPRTRRRRTVARTCVMLVSGLWPILSLGGAQGRARHAVPGPQRLWAALRRRPSPSVNR